MSFLSHRLPDKTSALGVYSILVGLIFTWMLYRFFWYLPSWLEYMSIGSVAIILAYSLAFAWVESLAMMGLFLGLCLALPRRLFREHFCAQGSLLALGLGGAAYLMQRQVGMIYRWEPWQVGLVGLGILLGILGLLAASAIALRRFPALERLAAAFAERMTIFALLYAPLGGLALLVVLIRNLLPGVHT